MKQKIASTLNLLLHEDLIVEKPKNSNFGDFAIPIFSLAKKYSKSLDEIANDFISKMESTSDFEVVTFVKGFVNFKVSDTFLSKYIENEFFSKNIAKNYNEKILVEYVSANPTGPLHIGHARGAIFGDTLIRAGKYLGYDIDAEYYVNDGGRQIKLLGVSLSYAIKKYILDIDINEPEEYYRGEYIISLAKELYEELGSGCEDDISTLADHAKDKMLTIIKKDLADVNVFMDSYASEKEMFKERDKTLQALKDSGGSYEQDGKLWLRTKKKGDEFDRVMVRESGEATYMLGDLIYHKNKFDRGYTHCINIWGADHHGYIARIKSSIDYLGYDSSNLEVLITQMVSLLKDKKPYKMSKRAGNFIIMSDVTEEIGSNLLRFIFLSKKADTHLEFDVSDFKSSDNPVNYILSAYNKLEDLVSSSNISLKDIELTNLSATTHMLVVESLLLGSVVADLFKSRQTQKLTEYVKNLSSMIHSFYAKEVGGKNEKELYEVASIALFSLKQALEILGINKDEK